MKNIQNKVFVGFTGEAIQSEGKPFDVKSVLITHIGNYDATGKEAVLTWRLGLKVEKQTIDSMLMLEDAEFDLLKKICQPVKPIYKAVIYGQLEEIFEAAEKG